MVLESVSRFDRHCAAQAHCIFFRCDTGVIKSIAQESARRKLESRRIGGQIMKRRGLAVAVFYLYAGSC